MTKLVVSKDRISVLESERYVSGTSNAYKCTVTFSKDWECLERKLAFRVDLSSKDVCDTVFESVPIPSLAQAFSIPSKLFAFPATKIQVFAIGCKKTDSSNVVLRTPWTSLGRVLEGGHTPCIPSDPDDPEDPPSISQIPPGGLKDQVLAKASDDDYDFYWMSISGLPIVSSSGINAPIKSVTYFAGDLSEIPEGWVLCDGQNGTPDLRDKVIIGKDPNQSKSSFGISEGTTVAVYALWPIMNLSAQSDCKPGADGKSAYEIAVERGFEGTEDEWLKYLKGASAYELAVQAGFLGSEETFSKALSALASLPVISNVAINSSFDLPTQGDGAYIFNNVTIASITFTHEFVYLNTETPNHIRLTLLSGTVYDFVTSTEESEEIVNVESYLQTIPIRSFDGEVFQTLSDILKQNAIGTLHFVNCRFLLTNYSDLNFQNDIVYLECYSNNFTLYALNGNWYRFEIGENQTFVYVDNGKLLNHKASLVSYDHSASGLKAEDVQSAIDELASRSNAGGNTPNKAVDVVFDDTDAKLNASDVQAAINVLASASPIIKNFDFSNLTHLTDYQMNQTYRMLNVTFNMLTGDAPLRFVNDMVWMGQNPDDKTLEIYTLDGRHISIEVDNDNVFTSFVQEDAYTSAAPDPLPFIVVENVTFTSLSQFEELGIVNDEVFLVRNITFRIPDMDSDVIAVTGSDFVKASWSVNMSLNIYSTGKRYRIEWNGEAEDKPFSKIEDDSVDEPLTTFIDVTTNNINELNELKTFFGRAIKARSVRLRTSGSAERDYENDVIYAENNKVSKIMTITRLNNNVDIFSYDDNGVFTSIVSRQNGSEELTFGDGLIKTDDTVSVYNPIRGIYTSDEFNSLSDEEKKVGTYIIDEDGTISGDVPVMDVYSLDEKIIGRWIDGRPLYRKTLSSILSTGVKSLPLDGIDSIIEINGFYIMNRYKIPVQLHTGPEYGSSEYVSIYLQDDTLYYRAGSSVSSNQAYITVTYTKVLDTPSIDLSDLIEQNSEYLEANEQDGLLYNDNQEVS